MDIEVGAVSPVPFSAAGRDEPRSASDPSSDRVAEAPDDSATQFTEISKNPYNEHARLSIDRDEEADSFVYRILDNRSGEVIRQFPQEQILELLRFLGAHNGLVVDRKV